tara:strand:+ start:359 stop:556 length:198 start_codon:yes stop_codon:yes gene_type:complete
MKYENVAKHVLFEAAQHWKLYDQERLSWFVEHKVSDAEYELIMSAINREYEEWRGRLIDQEIISE